MHAKPIGHFRQTPPDAAIADDQEAFVIHFTRAQKITPVPLKPFATTRGEMRL